MYNLRQRVSDISEDLREQGITEISDRLETAIWTDGK